MPESSIVIFADIPSQNRYRDLGIDKDSLSIFSCGEASAILERLRADVVVIDCGVSPRKGLRLLKEIKALRPQIPVIFITDASSEHTAVAAFRAGTREYFAQPVNRLALKKTIRGLVEARKMAAETRKPFGPLHVHETKEVSGFDEKKLPSRLAEVLLYIDENLSDKITLSSLAEGVRMSKYHFSRYFLKHIGKSPIQYVNFVRVKRAQDLLEKGEMTVSQIAHQVGYDDMNALLRRFKKVTGMTPTEFRKKRDRDHCDMM